MAASNKSCTVGHGHMFLHVTANAGSDTEMPDYQIVYIRLVKPLFFVAIPQKHVHPKGESRA
jgi:hypothetical protein